MLPASARASPRPNSRARKLTAYRFPRRGRLPFARPGPLMNTREGQPAVHAGRHHPRAPGMRHGTAPCTAADHRAHGASIARREDALPVDHQGGEYDDPRGKVRVEVGIAVKIRVGDVIHQRDESRQEGDKDKGARDLTPHRELASVRSYLRACSQPLLYTAPG